MSSPVSPRTEIPAAVLRRWGGLADARLTPIPSGLINLTLLVEQRGGRRTILQRLHPVFDPEVNLDIAAVTAHLASRGLATPRLVPADDGALWVPAEDGVWRTLTYVDGLAHDRLADPAMAREAGRLVGRFHLALADLRHEYRSRRGNVHDTPAHLARLRAALERHRDHRLHAEASRLGERLLDQAERLAPLDGLPARHAHGDLKISNLMFDAAGRGVCLIDLDTLTRMSWPLEMGDALRSWCNPNREDQGAARLDLALFGAAVAGYREGSGNLIEPGEWESLVPGLIRICLELASRFLADALNESYFGWDPRRYPARGEHNLARAQAMAALYRDVLRLRGEAEAIVRGR